MATSTSTVGLPEDKAYLLHHVSAGATPGKQERCPEGLRLWQAYCLATTPQEQPFFQLRDLVEHKGLVCLSANFELYGDTSDRMMSLAAPALKSYENIVRELKACYSTYAGKPFSALPAIAISYRPVGDDKKPMSAATVRNRLSYLRAACRYAWKHHGLGDRNPAERVSMPKVRNERHVYLGRAEFLKICSKIRPGKERAAIRIAFYSGMRAAEVGLAQVTYGGDLFGLGGQHTKNGMPRAVPIHPRVAHIVRNPTLWPVKPTKWTVSKAFKAGARAAGFGHARLHDLRHSTASEMINAGVDLYTVGGVLGHKSAVSSKRYSHLATQTLQSAVAFVGKKARTPAKKKAV